nr:MAG TPA: hypothetical protein [Caudoviricetes sp.]
MQDKSFDKTSVNKTKSPTLPTSTQRGTQGFDKAGDFLCHRNGKV